MSLLTATENYINTVLSMPTPTVAIGKDQLNKLPLFIRKKYFFCKGELQNKQILLLQEKGQAVFSIQHRINHLLQTKKIMNTDCVLVLEKLTANDRNRLIRDNIPFIVPGKQMYLPNLMIDLREHFDKKQSKSDRLLPSAQLILLYHLQKTSLNNMTLSDIGTKLGYTRMTMSRAVRELESLELCELTSSGREKRINFDLEKQELWEKSQQFLRSPIRSVVKIMDNKIIKDLKAIPSGISALSMISDISAGKSADYAVSYEAFRNYKRHHNVEISEFEDEGISLELWYYSPLILGTNMIDPLSLKLSLRENPDARIQHAINNIKWDKV